jgi:hypothetical protein
MAKPAPPTRLRFEPIAGIRPSLEWRRVHELQIDSTYQRTIETDRSRTLINRIAQAWDWNLCQPLAVAKRGDGSLMVVDGQHRLAAARLRNDIWDLPCVVTAYDGAGEEAAAFVALNQQRRPLSKLELFKASLVAGDEEARAVMRLIEGAGLSLAQHTNWVAWRPGALANISGIRACYRGNGPEVTAAALAAIAGGFPSAVLRFAGTIFPGLASFIASEAEEKRPVDQELLIMVLQGAGQEQWVSEILLEQAATGANRRAACEAVVARAYAEAVAEMDEAS